MKTSFLASEEIGSARRWDLPALGTGAAGPRTARQLEDTESTAREEGLAQGRREGFAQGMREAQALSARLNALIENFARPLENLDASVERELAELALKVGRELALRELRADPAAVAELVREAIKCIAPPPREVHLFLNPADLAAVRELLTAQPPAAQWQAHADAALQPGDCRVRAEASTVNARLDARVAELAASLLGDAP